MAKKFSISFTNFCLLTFWPVPSSFRDWFWSYNREMANKAYSQQLRGFKHLFVENIPKEKRSPDITIQVTRFPDITTLGPLTPFQSSTSPSEADSSQIHSSSPWLYILLSSLSGVLLSTGVALWLKNRSHTTATHSDPIEC